MSLSGLLRPEQFSLDGEESTIKCLLAQPPFWISRRYWKLRNGLSLLFIFACGSSAGPYTPEFVDAQSFSYPVCPNQKVTVIFGLVPILPQMSLVIPSFPLLPWIGNHYDEARLVSEFHENHSVRLSQLWGWKRKRLWSGPGWHRPCESLWKHCPRMLLRGPGCWWAHLSDEILTPWHPKMFHNMWDITPSIWWHWDLGCFILF